MYNIISSGSKNESKNIAPNSGKNNDYLEKYPVLGHGEFSVVYDLFKISKIEKIWCQSVYIFLSSYFNLSKIIRVTMTKKLTENILIIKLAFIFSIRCPEI